MSSRAEATIAALVERSDTGGTYSYAFLDEHSKREIRRRTLKAICIPGHQVPFGSRELPLARGWGSGGLQLSLSLIGPADVFKCIDQGDDASVNAVKIREFIAQMAGVETTVDTTAATLIQTRHRVPEQALRADQVLVLQVPMPEPLSVVEPRGTETLRMHAERDYTRLWRALYESIATHGQITVSSRYPVMVNGYLMDPSPIPRWDVPKLDGAAHLSLFGAGREKRIYAVPPHTSVRPLEFEDYGFDVERFDEPCRRCGSRDSFLTEVTDSRSGERYLACSDTSFCDRRLAACDALSSGRPA